MAAQGLKVPRRVFALESPVEPLVRWAKTELPPDLDWGWLEHSSRICPDPEDRLAYWNVVNEIEDWESTRWFERQSRHLCGTISSVRIVLISLCRGSRGSIPVLVLAPQTVRMLYAAGVEVIRVEAPDHLYSLMTPKERGVAGGINYNDTVGSWRTGSTPHTLWGKHRFVNLA